MGAFKAPHGGELKNLYLSADDAAAEKNGGSRLSVVGPDRAA